MTASSPILGYYGDDLTGSTDVMEALSTHGVSTVLFTSIPDEATASRFADRMAFGIAGSSRSETPAWMDEHLPPVFEWLRASGAALCHYKICSTFDSSPDVGSIGRAIDIGAGVFRQQVTPLVVGAPELKRYTAFGHLFAHYGPDVFRIDRHPVMQSHPVTPMHEADLRLHLSKQTNRSIGLVDFVQLKQRPNLVNLRRTFDAFEIILFDILDEDSKAQTGRILWEARAGCRFIVGSSGVEYALVSAGSATPLSRSPVHHPKPGSRGPIAVVSGSCSPTTGRQIEAALAAGFDGIFLDGRELLDGNENAIEKAADAASKVLRDGRSPLIYTARGAADIAQEGAGNHAIGRGLGRLLSLLVERHRLRRVTVAGGDTSSHAIRELKINALELLSPLPDCRGSPLCRASRQGNQMLALQVLEIAFKGGQVGTDNYFSIARDT